MNEINGRKLISNEMRGVCFSKVSLPAMMDISVLCKLCIVRLALHKFGHSPYSHQTERSAGWPTPQRTIKSKSENICNYIEPGAVQVAVEF